MAGERRCRACREVLAASAFEAGANVCGVCTDPAAAWEGARTPPAWERFGRDDALGAWVAREDARLAAELEDKARRIEVLDWQVRDAARLALGAAPSPAWSTIVGALVIAAWDTARRLGGVPELQVGPRSRRRALRTFAMVARRRYEVVVDEDGRVVVRRGDELVTRAAWHAPRLVELEPRVPIALQVALELAIEGAGRPRFANVAAALELAVYGEQQLGVGRGRDFVVAEDRDGDIAARAQLRARGQRLPRGAGGFLPVEHMPARQSRAGATCGARGEVDVELRVDVLRAVREAGVGPVDLAMLVAADVGVWRALPRARGADARELVRLRPSQVVGELRRAAPDLMTTAQAVGKRIGRTREAIAKHLEARALVPLLEDRPRARRRTEVETRAVAPLPVPGGL